MMIERLWLHLLHSVSLADDLGDVADDLRQFAKLLRLPFPPDDADFKGWRTWLERQHIVTEGIYSDTADREAGR